LTKDFNLYVSDTSGDSDSSDDEETQGKSTSRPSLYDKRKQNSAKNWENIRSLLRDVVIESECIPIGQTCRACNAAQQITDV
jgi:hypothetical protein